MATKLRKHKLSKLPPPVKKRSSKNTGVRTLTPSEYAELRNVSLQLVCRALRKGKLDSRSLTGVKSFSKHSRFYLLQVDVDKAINTL